MTNLPHLASYNEAEEWLLSMTDYERLLGNQSLKYNTQTFDLERFREQLRGLGDPHLRYAVIHVAGTKGKGSTCAFLESALRSCGFRTGLYTSPHLYRFTERTKFNGIDISDADFCRLVESMGSRIMGKPTASDGDEPRSFRTVFEILTAAAFKHFADQQVDIAIIETGLGGRLDSTNVFDLPGSYPLINIITPIGLDHMSILGETIEAIAGEKAGILRGHASAVLAKQTSPDSESRVRAVMEKQLIEAHATRPLLPIGDLITIERAADGENVVFRATEQHTPVDRPLAAGLQKGMSLRPALEGAHQHNNAATALIALRELEMALASGQYHERPAGGAWPALEPALVASGLETTYWPGRFTVVEREVSIVIDGAHCAISAAALAETCRARFGDKPAILVTGFLKDKAGGVILNALKDRLPVAAAIALPPPTPRAESAAYIRDSLEAVFGKSIVQGSNSIAEALTVARSMAGELNGYVVVFGSLYLVGPALDALKPR